MHARDESCGQISAYNINMWGWATKLNHQGHLGSINNFPIIPYTDYSIVGFSLGPLITIHRNNYDNQHGTTTIIIFSPGQSCQSTEYPDHDSSLLRIGVGKDMKHSNHLIMQTLVIVVNFFLAKWVCTHLEDESSNIHEH